MHLMDLGLGAAKARDPEAQTKKGKSGDSSARGDDKIMERLARLSLASAMQLRAVISIIMHTMLVDAESAEIGAMKKS